MRLSEIQWLVTVMSFAGKDGAGVAVTQNPLLAHNPRLDPKSPPRRQPGRGAEEFVSYYLGAGAVSADAAFHINAEDNCQRRIAYDYLGLPGCSDTYHLYP